MNEIQECAKTAIAEVIARQAPPKINWDDSPLAEFLRVEIDTRGTVGELLAVKLLEKGGREPVYNEGATDEDKHWDFMCDGLTYEVKTASLGKDGSSFQHENIFKTRLYDGLILVDIAPDEIYISLWARKAIPWEKLHSRKDGAYYKWDTSLTALSRLNSGHAPNQFCVRKNAIRTVADFMRRFAELEREIHAKKRPAPAL